MKFKFTVEEIGAEQDLVTGKTRVVRLLCATGGFVKVHFPASEPVKLGDAFVLSADKPEAPKVEAPKTEHPKPAAHKK
jgi:hypothetical protein